MATQHGRGGVSSSSSSRRSWRKTEGVPGSISEGRDVQPAYPPGAASSGAILPANLPQGVSSLTKDLCWVGSCSHPSRVCLCLHPPRPVTCLLVVILPQLLCCDVICFAVLVCSVLNPSLLMGTEAPVMTPNGVDFLFCPIPGSCLVLCYTCCAVR